jgi:gliding motility-associated lipoprotein GldH
MKGLKLSLAIVLLFTLAISSISCDKGPVYEKYLSMKNTVSDRFDQKLYEIQIDDINKSYDITLSARVTEQFQYDNLPVYVILTTPSGEERMREVSIPVRGNNHMLGLPIGKLFESRIVLWKNINMAEKGKCKISIENMIPKIQTEGIDALGITLTVAK